MEEAKGTREENMGYECEFLGNGGGIGNLSIPETPDASEYLLDTALWGGVCADNRFLASSGVMFRAAMRDARALC